VVGRPDEITGTAIVAFVTPRGNIRAGRSLHKDLKAHVSKEIGGIARPADIRFTNALPKTRSGKIMRRLLRNIASGEKPTGDTSTLEDFSVLASLSESDEN
jgi:acetyl-CoA synthetase